MITCLIRYTVDMNKLDEFEQYARIWIRLIEKHGGTHHGYFMPDPGKPIATTFSFPGLGSDGPPNLAVALFSFPDQETYETYRREVGKEEECQVATTIRDTSKCFTSYERNFLRPVLGS